MDYSNLSNEELGQMLVDYGVNVGPISVTTRTTYERKLSKLQTGQASPPPAQPEPVEDDDDDDEVQIRAPPLRRSPQKHSPQKHSPPRRHSPIKTEILHPEPVQPRLRRDYADASSYSPRIESRADLNVPRKATALYSESRFTPRPVQRSSPPRSPPRVENKGIPLWVKIIAAFVIAALIYLIYTNMESQAASSIPGVSHKVKV